MGLTEAQTERVLAESVHVFRLNNRVVAAMPVTRRSVAIAVIKIMGAVALLAGLASLLLALVR